MNYLNARLVGILRTKPKTPALNAICAIETAFNAGAQAVEITSNSDFWQEILTGCVKAKLNIGVGSIKNEKTANEAINLGAKFLVSPGFFEDTIEAANKNKSARTSTFQQDPTQPQIVLPPEGDEDEEESSFKGKINE